MKEPKMKPPGWDDSFDESFSNTENPGNKLWGNGSSSNKYMLEPPSDLLLFCGQPFAVRDNTFSTLMA